MRSALVFSLAVIAGSVLAAPKPHDKSANKRENVVVYKTKTVHVNADGELLSKPANEGDNDDPEDDEPDKIPNSDYLVHWEVTPHSKPQNPAKPDPSKNQPPGSTLPPNANGASKPHGGSKPDDGSFPHYVSVVNEWRVKLGLPTLLHSTHLEANCDKTTKASKGQMKHHLFAGTNGQCLAPLVDDDFQKTFIGGWLCEDPEHPALRVPCHSLKDKWNYQGKRGHYEIITNAKYNSVGCATHDKILCCDFAFNKPTEVENAPPA